MNTDTIVVSAPAHLHAGNYEFSRLYGRVLGTVGVTIAWPRTTIRAWRCRELRVEGPYSTLVEEFLEKLDASNVCVRVYEAISRGIGLGGTTALALSTAVAATWLRSGRVTFNDLVEAARVLGRARWSGLGLYSFAYGGFIVDGGVADRYPPPLTARLPLPSSWRIVVAVIEDRVNDIRKLKSSEEEILERLPRVHEDFSARLSRLILAGALPCIAEERLSCFINALYKYNRSLGEYWARLGQKGVYCCPEAEEAVEELEDEGVLMIQSSWGPSLWTIVAAGEAHNIASRVESVFQRIGVKATVWTVRGDNTGAVTVPGDAAGWRALLF